MKCETRSTVFACKLMSKHPQIFSFHQLHPQNIRLNEQSTSEKKCSLHNIKWPSKYKDRQLRIQETSQAHNHQK